MISINGHVIAVNALATMDRGALVQMNPDELAEMVVKLSQRLLKYTDRMVGPREVAEMFGRRKSWIYDAMARPRTELQRRIGRLACREGGMILFRMSDMVQLRNEIMGGEYAKS